MPIVGFNQFMQPENSLVSTGDIDSNYLFASKYERGLITRAFMGSASIGSAQIGSASVGTAQIISVLANQLLAGTITVALNVGTGSGSVVIDGANNRFIINDGTTNRIIIGKI